MIHARELRIGNLIDFEGATVVVKELDEQGVVVYLEEDEWIDLFQFTPIPLTEKHFVDAGYVCTLENSVGKQYCFPNNGILSDDLLFTVWKDGEIYGKGKKIKSLHYLQNLHFFISGEELILNNQ